MPTENPLTPAMLGPIMPDMGAALAVVNETMEPGRYAVSVWMAGTDEAITQHVATPGEAAEIVLWMKGDPGTVRIVTVDTATGKRVTVWAR